LVSVSSFGLQVCDLLGQWPKILDRLDLGILGANLALVASKELRQVVLGRIVLGDLEPISLLQNRSVVVHLAKLPVPSNLAGNPMALALLVLKVKLWIAVVWNPYATGWDVACSA
jgi:hypothetical protein